MPVSFQITLTEDHMYDFLLKHYYTHMGGIVSTIAGIFSVIMAGIFVYTGNFTQSGLWIMMAFIFLYVNRMTLRSKARMQVKQSDMINKPIYCELTDDGVVISRDGDTVTNPWENFTKVYTTKKVVILYVGRVRAFILPKEQIGDQYQAAVEMICQYIPRKKIRGLK